MTALYITLFVLVCFAELSSKVNTDNLIEKLGLMLIGLGALLDMIKPTIFIPLGLSMYMSSICYQCYIRKRRASDGRKQTAR